MVPPRVRCGSGYTPRAMRDPIPTHFFSLTVVRLGHRFLLVHERKHGQLWYLPAGRMERTERFEDAALRETLEESGVRVALDGVLRLEVTPGPTQNRIRVFFLAHPIDDAPPLCAPNEHSLEAGWFTLGEVERLPLRGQEVFEILSAVERGAPVHPLSLLQLEGARWS